MASILSPRFQWVAFYCSIVINDISLLFFSNMFFSPGTKIETSKFWLYVIHLESHIYIHTFIQILAHLVSSKCGLTISSLEKRKPNQHRWLSSSHQNTKQLKIPNGCSRFCAFSQNASQFSWTLLPVDFFSAASHSDILFLNWSLHKTTQLNFIINIVLSVLGSYMPKNERNDFFNIQTTVSPRQRVYYFI